MPIKSKIIDGIIYTEISGEIDYDTVIQQIDFISSLKNEITNRFELLDHTNITKINISSEEMRNIANYSIIKESFFKFSFLAIYVPNDIIFGMVRMFEAYFELEGHPINTLIFRDKDEAIQHLKDVKREHES